MGYRYSNYPFTCRAFSRSNGYRKERFRVRGHIFVDAFSWLNRHSSSFNDPFRVKKVNLAMYILLFTCRVIGEKIIRDA